MHFNRSIVLGYHSIPKINWGSFRGRGEEKWRSFRGRFGDHFRVGDHFGVGIISGAVQISSCFFLLGEGYLKGEAFQLLLLIIITITKLSNLIGYQLP